MKFLVTGGSGFIGSNFIKLLVNEERDARVVNIDRKTYAARGDNIEHMGFPLAKQGRYRFYEEDICDLKSMDDIISSEKPDVLVNFAAESHVDRSISNSSDFIRTNIVGAHTLLEAAKSAGIERFIQISTDEVYGSLSKDDRPSKETDALNQRSPYSASKAAAEHIAISYFHTHKLPVIVTRSSNNYGPYQFPEKLVPLFVTNLLEGKKVPLMHSPENPGLNVRDWLHVEDNCRAILHVIKKGKIGEAYNIGGGNERTNMEITLGILKNLGMNEGMIEHVPHRAGHDFRYALDDSKLLESGFKKKYSSLERGLSDTINWYKNNRAWWEPLKR